MKELIEIQKELKAPKSQFNSFGKYNYRSAEDILEAVKPLCCERGVLLTLSDDVVQVGDRIYVKATASVSKGDETVSVNAFAREEEDKKGMDSSQITGTASSYARKYALNGLFCIDDTKDADTDEYKKQNDKKPQNVQQKKNELTPLEKITAICNEKSISWQVFREMYGIPSNYKEVPESRWVEILREMEGK